MPASRISGWKFFLIKLHYRMNLSQLKIRNIISRLFEWLGVIKELICSAFNFHNLLKISINFATFSECFYVKNSRFYKNIGQSFDTRENLLKKVIMPTRERIAEEFGKITHYERDFEIPKLLKENFKTSQTSIISTIIHLEVLNKLLLCNLFCGWEAKPKPGG